MYRVHYRVWGDDGLVCCEGMADFFGDAFDRVSFWLENRNEWDTIAKIEFERIDDVPTGK